MICGDLPIFENISSGSLISIVADYVNNIECVSKEYDKQFKHYTNLQTELIIREGIRVMFLTNKLFKKELYNGNHIEIAFPINSGINQIVVEKITAYFNLHGASAWWTQFPL